VMSKNAAVFLDRDGVINKDPGYVYKIHDFKFISSVFEACKRFIQLNYQIIIITNQSGIARGFYSEKDFKQLTQWMLEQFKKHDVNITDVYFCPHHFKSGKDQYKLDCDCRKPKPGMIKQAEVEYQIDLKNSILFGDKLSDIKAGRTAGIGKNILIKNDQELDAKSLLLADGTYNDLFSASKSTLFSQVIEL